jgi:uncharacterized protein (DUF3820 family)
MTLSVLIHTFSKYSFLWEGYLNHWERNWGLGYPVTYFGTDIPCENDSIIFNSKKFQVKYSGSGEWSDRLKKLLLQIPADYILYMQEDHFPTKIPDLINLCRLVEKNNLLRLQISTVKHFYKLNGAGEVLFFDPYSKYLVSHQPSIWKKSFLLDCLKPGETPWVNEYKGTLRLQQTSQIRDYITNKIAIYPYDWYKHMCIKGKVVES